MIKILIDNEEVVSDSTLQIKEEMLSTSSTILKNCYPKAWEDTKDYNSNYYFPKDYSKCKIIEEEEIDFEILGETTQDGTPSPSNPVPIVNKTGEITETIGGMQHTFDLGSIELCKIGNYADRIYKSGEKWYVEKKIGKVTLDGSETWTMGTSSGYYYFQCDSPEDNVTNALCYSNCFKWSTPPTDIDNGINLTSTKITIGRPKTSSYIITLSSFEDLLDETPAVIYYRLTTPTTTEITDSTLLSQLNNVGQRLLFCGCVKNTGNISLNPRDPHYVDLQVLDFKTLLSEGETLNYVITGKTITEAINQVISSISEYGFIVGNIQILNPDDVINAYSTLNKTAYDVFQYIADITQSRWTTRMVDENTIAIDFYDPTLMPQASPIETTQEYFEQNDIEDISFNYSTNDYRNKQIMTSDEVFANITQTETLIADGYRDSFMCQNKIGVIGRITVNGVEKTFATKSEEELGVSADFIYTPGEMTFNANTTYSAGAVIVITYYPIVKGREIILNTTESNRISIQIGRKGTISRYENRNDTTSSQELIKIGQSYIKYKGSAEITLKVISGKDLFNVGQIVSYQAPLPELTTDYMVKSKTIDMYLNADEVFYTYELSSNFNSENAINYFDNQRAKSQGNIGEGETITRNIDLEATALIQFYDTKIDEVMVVNPTSLDFGLDGVLI